MVVLLAVLLYWQHVRFQLVTACRDQGGVWDGAAGRCKLVPPIYLERGIKRSDLAPGPAGPAPVQKRSTR
jgi:hypothetical protein